VTVLPAPLVQLAAALGRLPGIGPRSAERLSLYLVQADKQFVEHLAAVLVGARTSVGPCETCGALTEAQPCGICADPNRDGSVLCIVERPVDIFGFEKSRSFKGRYHVLGGKLSPTQGIGPEDLRIAELEQRISGEGVNEIILALGSDVEGDATSHYLARRLRAVGLKVTRLAQGLPVGSGLEYADELTLGRALEGRREMSPG
jgi:recombination protein RecR